HADGELLLEIQAALVGGTDADAVGVLGLEVEGIAGPQLIAADVEGSIVVGAGAGNQTERVGGVRIDDPQSADAGVGAAVLRKSAVGHGDIVDKKVPEFSPTGLVGGGEEQAVADGDECHGS